MQPFDVGGTDSTIATPQSASAFTSKHTSIPTITTTDSKPVDNDNTRSQSGIDGKQGLKLDALSAASLDQTFQEELQHVNRWFSYLTEAERTATVVTLLQHSSPLQITFFTHLLQEMKKSKAETVNRSSQRASALMNLSIRAPTQQLHPSTSSTANPALGGLHLNNRHSYAIGDPINDRSALFGFMGTDWFSSPDENTASAKLQQQTQESKLSNASTARTRPASSIEHEFDPSFANSWLNRRQSNIMLQQQQQNFIERPRSADISSWSTATPGGTHPPSLLSSLNRPSKHTSWMPFDYTTLHEDEYDSPDFLSTTTTQHPFNTTATINNNTNSNQFPAFNSSRRRSSYALQSQSQSQPPPPQQQQQQQQQYNPVMYGSSFNSNSTARLSTSRSSSQESASQDGLYGYNSDYSEPVPPTSASHRSHQHPRHSQQQQQHEQPPHSMSSSHLNGMHPQTISTTSTSTFMNNDNNDDYNVNLDLVKDVPAWLRSMRLHKYNPIFEKMRWQDIIQLDDEALKTKGVAALGARRKMLKVFDQVKEYCQQNNIEYST